MRPKLVILSSPPLGQHLGFPQGFKHLLVEQLIPELSGKTLHVAILPRTARLDVERPHPYGLEPVPNRLSGKLRK